MRTNTIQKLTPYILSGFLTLCATLPVQAAESNVKELTPGLNACLQKAKEAADPNSPNFSGAGEAREMTLTCYENALEQTDRELQNVISQAKLQCPKKADSDFGVEVADCQKRYDTFLQTGRTYRQATKVMLEMYWVGCPTCLFSETVENAVKETKRQINFVKKAASNYSDDIK